MSFLSTSSYLCIRRRFLFPGFNWSDSNSLRYHPKDCCPLLRPVNIWLDMLDFRKLDCFCLVFKFWYASHLWNQPSNVLFYGIFYPALNPRFLPSVWTDRVFGVDELIGDFFWEVLEPADVIMSGVLDWMAAFVEVKEARTSKIYDVIGILDTLIEGA